MTLFSARFPANKQVPLHPGGGARAVGDDVHCFECEEALLRQLHREKHITFCGGSGVGHGTQSDEMCGCAAPVGKEHKCRSSAVATGGQGDISRGGGSTAAETEASFDISDADRDRMRRVFERAERDKRKERERNIKREGKGAAASQGTAGGSDA